MVTIRGQHEEPERETARHVAGIEPEIAHTPFVERILHMVKRVEKVMKQACKKRREETTITKFRCP